MLKINKNIIIKMLMFMAVYLITIQFFLVYVFHLPTFIQFFYLFLIVGLILCILMSGKNAIKLLDKNFITLSILFLVLSLISCVINNDDLVNRGMPFVYYVKKFSKFWDSPSVSLFAWGLMRPFLYFLFALLLMVFYNQKGILRYTLKSLIILGVISAIYSVYQVIAGIYSLPYGSIFSGHDGEEIFLFGNIRRVEGIFFEPGPQAANLSPIFTLLLFNLFEKNKFNRFFSKSSTIVFLLLLLFTLIFTFSPVGIIGAILSIVFCVFFNYDLIKKWALKRKNVPKIIVISALLIIIFSTVGSLIISINEQMPLIKNMVDKITSSSLNEPFIYLNPDNRSVRNFVGMNMFQESPLWGKGPGSGIFYYYKYAHFSSVLTFPAVVSILNQHVKILGEHGILGFSVYILILIYPIFLYMKNFKKVNISLNKNIICSLVSIQLIFIIVTLKAGLYFYQAIFWLFYVAIIICIQKFIYKNKI